MAVPTCPKCDSKNFAMTLIEPHNSYFKINAVHCMKCGAVVGITDYSDVATLVRQLAEKLHVKLD